MILGKVSGSQPAHSQRSIQASALAAPLELDLASSWLLAAPAQAHSTIEPRASLAVVSLVDSAYCSHHG